MKSNTNDPPAEIEYDSLRQEILETYNREVNLISIGIAATSAIIGFGLNVKIALVFIVPLFILALTLTQMNNCVYTVLSIAVYIRTQIEPKRKDLNWEGTIYKLRTTLRQQKRKNPLTRSFEINYTVGVIVIGLLCIALSFAYSQLMYEYLVAGVSLIIWLFFSISTYRQIKRASSGKLEKELELQYQRKQSKD